MTAVQVCNPEPATYFERLAEAVEAHYEYHGHELNAKGFKADGEHFADLGLDWNPMHRGTNQTRSYRFFTAKTDKRGRYYEVERYLYISLYRLDSGRYEALAYVS